MVAHTNKRQLTQGMSKQDFIYRLYFVLASSVVEASSDDDHIEKNV